MQDSTVAYVMIYFSVQLLNASHSHCFDCVITAELETHFHSSLSSAQREGMGKVSTVCSDCK